MIDKKGEKYFSIYACFPYFIHKGEEEFLFMHICFVLQKGEKNLMSFMLDWYVYLLSLIHISEYIAYYALCELGLVIPSSCNA